MASGPYRGAGSADDRTWDQTTWARVQWFAAPLIIAVLAAVFWTSYVDGAGNRWFVRVFGVLFVLGLVSAVAEILRTAYRVTLRRDGTLELVRPIGTVRVRVEQVRAMRVSRFDNHRSSPIRLVSEQGTYRIQRGLDDVHGLVEVLRERNPRIELPAI